MTSPYSLSVIVPLYNEARVLEKALSRMVEFHSRHFADFEIMVVESGSTDGSGALCDEIGKQDPHIKVIHEGARKGFGSALRLGFKNATKDLVWIVSVDIPFPMDAILRALPLLGQYDCVLSYRSIDPRNAFRRIQSFVYNLIVKAALGLRFRSVNSAFKVFKRPLLQGMSLISNGPFIDAEILYRIQKQGISYAQIPVDLVDRTAGKSTVGPLAFVSILGELIHFARAKDSPN